MRFNNYLIEGNIGEDMEKAIVSVWNTGRLEKGVNTGIDEDGVKKIVKNLRSAPIGIKARSARKVERNEVTVSKWWEKYTKDNTPKTDLLIGNYKLSVKTGPAQLMSGTLTGDALAVFLTAVDQSSSKSTLIKSIISQFESIPTVTVSDNPKKAELRMMDKVREMNKKLTNDMNRFFQNNPEIHFNFVKEAMTGVRKFKSDGGTPLGSADYVLYCETNGTTFLHKIEKKYVSKVAQNVKLNVNFKSNSNKEGRRSYSTVRLAIDAIEKLKSLKKEAIQKHGPVLTENVFVDMWEKVKTWFLDKLSMIAEWIGDSFERLLEFMGIEPTEDIDVDVSGVVDFS